MTITVYAHDADEVVKKLERIGKKAAKYNVPFSYERGEEHPEEVSVWEFNHVAGEEYVVDRYMVAAVDFEVECEGFIKANGWRVCAKIEHGDKGNIVTGMNNFFGDDSEIDPAWYDAPPRCEHCGTNRKRAVTFMVKREDGTVRQVGRSCLKDYTGIDPATAALWAAVCDICVNDFRIDVGGFHEMRAQEMFEIETILAHAVDEVAKNGYRKADDRDSTRGEVAKLLREHAAPSEDGKAKAKQIVEWLLTDCDQDGVIGIERDCVALAKSGYAKMKHLGRLCYMPVAIEKAQERKVREAERAAGKATEAEQSKFVGEVGKRIEIDVASAKIITSWETDYGRTFLYKFVGEDGNVFIWRASGMMYDSKADRVIPEETIKRIKGTVKEHSEYDGVKQTVLTRCKAI